MPTEFRDIAEEFERRWKRIVWCSVTTVDTKGRPRSRVLHPIWEGPVGWIATHRDSLKAKHLAQNPYVSLSYLEILKPFGTEQIHAECKTVWDDSPETRKRIWRLLESTPPPVGYDPQGFWKSAEDPRFGVLRLTPWRIELTSLKTTGWTQQVWQPISCFTRTVTLR